MSFLAPWALLLAAAAAVPLLLHLLRRRTGTRVEFPAVRYLLRAEKEHAREVRLRNLLLMLLRVGIVLAIALAMAKPVGLLPGFGHPPTAVVLLLDNSMSSGAAGGEGPMLSRLTAGARAVIDAAGRGDELTMVTFDGEALSGTPGDLRDALSALRPLDGAGDPAAALARAEALLSATALQERRLVLLTDGQSSSWDSSVVSPASSGARPVTTLAFQPGGAAPANRAVATLSVEPPHWNPRGLVRATLLGDSASWRLLLDGRSVARGTAAPGEPIIARVQPAARGWLAGAVELEPDEFRGDDVRHFAVHVGEAPAVAVDAASGAFLRGAVDALVDAGRVRRGTELFVGSSERARTPGLFFAPADPLRVPDANRALERAGIPWRFGARRSAAVLVRGGPADGITARTWYELTSLGGANSDTLAWVGARPWVLAGDGYVLVASPPTADATDLPLRAAFVPWLDALLSSRLSVAGGVATDVAPGARIQVPMGVDALERPDGSLQDVTAGASMRAPWTAGVSFWRRGAKRQGALVVNPEPSESDSNRLDSSALQALLGAEMHTSNPASLARLTYAAGGRRALSTPLMLLALALLLAESLLARRGRRARSAD